MKDSTIARTKRLTIRELNIADACFILELVNQPAWLQHIGDKNVNTIAQAQEYLASEPISMYRKFGFGLFMVELSEKKQALGICGLVKRNNCSEVEIGFAFLSNYWKFGYAYESALAVIEFAEHTINLPQITAICTTDNKPSASLLEKLGFEFDKKVQAETADKNLNHYCLNLSRLKD